MPTALRIGPYRFYFYSYDCQEPRHMHVDRESSSCKLWLDPTVVIADNDGYSRRKLREIERLALEHIAVPIGWFPRLVYGAPDERANVQLAGAGHGLHWPDLEEDIGVDGLLLGKKSTESASSFAQWLARRKQG